MLNVVYSIEVDAKIDQQDKKIDKMLSFMTISTNSSDINPKVSEVTENRKGEDDNEEYDVNMIVDGVTSQHILYYCTYYSVSLTCTVTVTLIPLHHMFPCFPC